MTSNENSLGVARQPNDAGKRSPLNQKVILSNRTRAIKNIMAEKSLTRSQAESKYDKEQNHLIRERFARKSKGG